MSDIFNGTFEFKDLGRYQYNGFIEVESEKDFWKELKKHLMSENIDWTFDEKRNQGRIFVGGFRMVGEFRRVINERTTT